MVQGRKSMIREADDSFMDRAYCRVNGIPTDEFFADDGNPYSARGRRACSKCEVRAECLAFGQAIGATGLWGGRSLRYGKLRRKEFDQDFACAQCGTGFIPYGKASTYCSPFCREKARRLRAASA